MSQSMTFYMVYNMTYDISNAIQSMIDMRLEEIPHFDLNPETFLTTRPQVEVKVKVLLPVKKNCVNCCLFRCCSTFVAFPASISFVAHSVLPCTAYFFGLLANLPAWILVYLPAYLLAYSSVQLTSLHYLPYPADPPPWPPPPPPL